MDIRKIVESQMRWIARQEGVVISEMASVFQDSLTEIDKKLKSIDPEAYTARHARAIRAQLEAILRETELRHANVLSESVKKTFASQLSLERDHWAGLERAFGDPEVAAQFAGISPVIPERKIAKLVSASDIAIKGMADDQIKAIRRAVSVGNVRGEGIEKIRRRVQKLTGLSERRSRLIARMETSRASNESKDEFIEQVNEKYPQLDLWQIIHAHVDKSKKTRNHWFSWALHNTVRNVSAKEKFMVTASQVSLTKAEFARVTGRRASGSVLWSGSDTTGYTGKALPAHFGDRDVQGAWRPGWPQDQFGTVKHPQGPIDAQAKTAASKADVVKETRSYSYSATQSSRSRSIPFSNDQKQALNKHLTPMEQMHINAPVEYLHTYDNAGKQVFPVKRGKAAEVDLSRVYTQAEQKLLKDKNISHNHKLGTALSSADIVAGINYNLNSIKAFGTSDFNGKLYIYQLNRKGPDWKLKPDSSYNGYSDSLPDTVFKMGDDFTEHIQSLYDVKLMFGKMTRPHANFSANMYVAHKIASQLDAILEIIVI